MNLILSGCWEKSHGAEELGAEESGELQMYHEGERMQNGWRRVGPLPGFS